MQKSSNIQECRKNAVGKAKLIECIDYHHGIKYPTHFSLQVSNIAWAPNLNEKKE